MGIETAKGIYDSTGALLGKGFVYLLVATEGPGHIAYLKVGHSVDPYSRTAGIRTGCPVPWVRFTTIQTPGLKSAQKLERALHDLLAEARSHGEWFRVSWHDLSERRELLARIGKVVSQHIRNPIVREVDPEAVLSSMTIKQSVNRRSARSAVN